MKAIEFKTSEGEKLMVMPQYVTSWSEWFAMGEKMGTQLWISGRDTKITLKLTFDEVTKLIAEAG